MNADKLSDEELDILNRLSEAIASGDMETFGQLLEERLEESDMSVTQFASENKLSRKTLYRTFQSNDDPRHSTLKKILKGFNLELSVQKR